MGQTKTIFTKNKPLFCFLFLFNFGLDMLKRRDHLGSLTDSFLRYSLITIPTTKFETNKLCNATKSFSSSADIRIFKSPLLAATRSHPNLSSFDYINNKKSNCVQLYKPIYVAIRSRTVKGQFSYDEGDEFELVSKIDENYFRVIHLRTNTECRIRRSRLRLDPETPLRLGTDDRNIIQRCLFEYNLPGAYLIRRSRNEPHAFVLSILETSDKKTTEDCHYLIYLDPSNNCFYFPQISKLAAMLFTSFHKLIHDTNVHKLLHLLKIMPFRIEFEDDLWHIPRYHLTFESLIGDGEFGEVWSGLWKNDNSSISVAIKKLNPLVNDKASINCFMREIETMKVLRNDYIVSLYGVAHDHQTKETLLVTELMENGDVKNWLRSCKDTPDEKIIIACAHDVCCGMLFLEENNLVHRDLACRNLLINKDRSRIKIADFGLSTLVNKYDFMQRKEVQINKLPVRWTAPEVLQDPTVYSIKSDVWSFGIVLIEIWLKGKDPYPEEVDFDEIETLVLSGYVHNKPTKCSNQFYNRLILPCLCFKPNQRPNFNSLVELLNRWNTEKAEYDRLNSACMTYAL